MSYTVLRPYARKFASVYSQVVDVTAAKTSDLETWTLILNDALTQYRDSRFFGSTELLGKLLARWTATFRSTVEIDGSLLAHGSATFESPATFTGSVYLPTLTYLNGSLLEPPKIAITGCTASDSTVWPSASWLVSASSTGTGSAAINAFDKSAATSWSSGSGIFNVNGNGSAFLTVQYPTAVVIKSFTITDSPDVIIVRLEGSSNGSTYNSVQFYDRRSMSIDDFLVTNTFPTSTGG
ncbi:hypothetical protein T492DRAFT_837591 [Pavlovales sp. CCMP2436]|nr:hypothetical protein T492DRAFT_837591 [Pavlovales sp. CCMP2436]